MLCSSQGAVDALPGNLTQAVHAGSGRGGVRQADSAESFQLEQEGDMGLSSLIRVYDRHVINWFTSSTPSLSSLFVIFVGIVVTGHQVFYRER